MVGQKKGSTKKGGQEKFKFHFWLMELANRLTGCSLTNHCRCEAGCDLPDVQFKFKYSPI